MNKNLILHAGFHKTGTTALQTCYFKNYENLKKVGLLFPNTGITFIKGSPRDGACSGHDNLLRMASIRSKTLIRKLETEGIYSHMTTLLSIENISHPFMSHKVFEQNLIDLLDMLPKYEKKVLVYTVKRPEKMFRSLYSELITGGNALYSEKYDTFFDNIINKADEYKKKLNTAKKLGFEIKFIFCSGNTIDHFEKFLLENNLINKKPSLNIENTITYSSPSLEHETIIREINGLGLSRALTRRISKKILEMPTDFFYNAGLEFERRHFDEELLNKHYKFINYVLNDFGFKIELIKDLSYQVNFVNILPNNIEEVLLILGFEEKYNQKSIFKLLNTLKLILKRTISTGHFYSRRIGFWNIVPNGLKDQLLNQLRKLI
ncbi:hypothetical protein [Alkalihalobacterium sp. APHAB7]|uniref:hypothetical protein n=1 Tax=Alkalihalobacterium sp. APHAB7 TaxID=3402081 RepID=UPI003AAE785A